MQVSCSDSLGAGALSSSPSMVAHALPLGGALSLGGGPLADAVFMRMRKQPGRTMARITTGSRTVSLPAGTDVLALALLSIYYYRQYHMPH